MFCRRKLLNYVAEITPEHENTKEHKEHEDGWAGFAGIDPILISTLQFLPIASANRNTQHVLAI